MPGSSQFDIDRTHPGRWTITFSNPPINMFVPATFVELGALMTDLDADPSVKVVVFQSANPDFFVAHLDVSKAAERPEVLGLWRDFVLRLSSTPVVSIGKISRPYARHRQRVGAGLRHAVRQPAKSALRQSRGRRRTGPGRRSAGVAPAPCRPLAGTGDRAQRRRFRC